MIVERKTVPQVDSSDPRNLYLLLGWSAVGLMGAGWATTGYLGYQSAQDRKDALDTKTSEASLNHLESKNQTLVFGIGYSRRHDHSRDRLDALLHLCCAQPLS